MNIVDQHTFQQTIASWEVVSIRQLQGFYQARSENYETLFLLDDSIASVAYLKTFMGCKMLLLETPAKRTANLSEKVLRHWYEALYNLPYDIIELNSSETYAPVEEVALRKAGWLRPIGLFSYPLTHCIDLTQPIHYNENWNRNLRTISDDLHFYECQDRIQGEKDMWELYQSMCLQKKLPVWPNLPFFHTLLSDPHFRLFFVEKDAQPISMILIHTSGIHAGLFYAANNEQGYAQKAGFYIYHCLLHQLQQEGFRSFDMEKLGFGARTSNAVALFKQGIKGHTTQLLGEWARYQHHWMRWAIYFVKRYIWHCTEV